MAYWVKRIILKTGEVVTERELRRDENRSEAPAPIVGDELVVSCRGRTFKSKVVWGNWPDRHHEPSVVVFLRVEEL